MLTYLVKERYPYEMGGIAFFLLVFVVWWTGSGSNERIANLWIKGVKEAITANFAHFGTLKDPSLALE